jgi:hypothetical protein
MMFLQKQADASIRRTLRHFLEILTTEG